MLLLHLSDLHLSRYGETHNWTREGDDEGWESLHTWRRWRVEGRRDRKKRPERLRLIDPEGVVHEISKWPTRKDDKAISKLVSLAMERHMTSTEALVKSRPETEDLESLLRVDRNNTNLRFLELLDRVLPLEPKVILITGDMTDNGFGYELITHYLEPWIAQGTLFVVPGNHDTYDMLPRWGRKERTQFKEDAYLGFARSVNNEPEECGAYVRTCGDVAIVGLSSCKMPLAPLSASGEVSREQLIWLAKLSKDAAFRKARRRICMVHHHLLRMPIELGKRSPMEIGLRLRNGAEVMRACADAGINMIFHGHRHYGYMVRLPAHPLVVSSPSSTLGCKSTELRYVWLVDLEQENSYPRVYRFTDEPAVDEGDEGPDESLHRG